MEKLIKIILLLKLNEIYIDVNYIGCYADFIDSIRDLPNQLINQSSSLSIETCISSCASNSYSYAGLQYG